MASYFESYQQRMNSFKAGLWAQPNLIPELESKIQDEVIKYLLGLACQAQNIQNIDLGQKALLSIPRRWLLQHIQHYTEPLLQLDDEWEYRRIGELYEMMDRELVRNLIARGLRAQNLDIEEAAKEFEGRLERNLDKG